MIGLLGVEGLKEIDRALAQLGAALSERVVEAALIEAAEPMRVAMGNLARRGMGAGPHLADQMLAARTDEHDLGDTGVVIEVGPELRPRDFFYGYFLEYGTQHAQAFPFARPAFDETRDQVVQRLIDELWGEIARAGGVRR
jgi:HK97 gp10 family phage protein